MAMDDNYFYNIYAFDCTEWFSNDRTDTALDTQAYVKTKLLLSIGNWVLMVYCLLRLQLP